MTEIDETIGQVEILYRALTGMSAPNAEAAYASIPPEKDPVLHVQEQMDRLLRALPAPSPFGMRTPFAVRPWMPLVTIAERDADVVLSFDVPGVTREHVEVSVQGAALLVSGHRGAQTDAQRVVVSERPTGPFRRVIPLPPGLKTADMSAQLKDGVLEVRIPRDGTQGTSGRTVPIS